MNSEGAGSGKTTRIPRKERRKRTRRTVRPRFHVQVFTEEMQQASLPPSTGLLTDVTSEGLGLILDQPLQAGAKVHVVLRPGTTKERLLKGTLIWLKPLPTTGKIIKFTDPAETRTEFWRIGVSLDPEKEQTEFIESLLSEGYSGS